MLPALLLGFAQTTSDFDALTAGVTTLIAPGALPGAVVASKNAFVILHTGDAPTLAAGPVERGRALVSGHGGFFSRRALADPSNLRLFQNALAWLGRKPVAGLRIGVLGTDDMASVAQKLGAETVSLRKDELKAQLLGVDVFFMGQSALDGDEAAQKAVVAWLKEGHGLYTAGPGWGWQQLNPSKNIRTDLGANRMLLPYGLGLSGETADGKPTTEGASDPLFHTETALAALRKGGLTSAQTARATRNVSRALALSPLDDRGLVAEIARFAAIERPAETWPIPETMPFSRLEAGVKRRQWEESAPEKVKADPSATLFPGPVPKEAKRVSRTVEIDTSVPEWHGLGLYAAPGEVVTVTLPPGTEGKGLGVRTASQTDALWDLKEWKRFPEISRRWPLERAKTKIATPFGGTIYLDVPADCKLGKIAVKIDGAVPAPRYVRGQTSAADWAKQLAEPGGPWAEFEAHQIILSVPRSAVMNLTDPEALGAYWDEVADLCYTLYAAPRRPRPERYSVDRQISAGYMHSGYPIMTWEDVSNTFTDVTKLRGNVSPWGFYHELGHNFQEGAWTFDGTGEVTNNLFSLYGSEKINGLPHPGEMRLDKRDARMKKYLANGAKFEDWKRDPFLALVMYDQLREAFGWEPFTKTFALYRRLKLEPKGEIAQHDEWMVRMSQAVGRNLGPFFTAWGVPTSERARSSVAGLPGWMPEGMS